MGGKEKDNEDQLIESKSRLKTVFTGTSFTHFGEKTTTGQGTGRKMRLEKQL